MYNTHIRESGGRLYGFTSVQRGGVWLDIHPLLDSFATDVRMRSILELPSVRRGGGHICIDKITWAFFLIERRYDTVGNMSGTSEDVSRIFDCLLFIY